MKKSNPSPSRLCSRRTVRVLQVTLAVWIAFGVWLIAFRGESRQAVPVLPDTETQFSLDLEVIGTAEHDVMYVVEQRARPAYRIFSFDPASRAVETLFTVPTDAIIFGIALNPERTTLAVSYSADFHIGGSGLSTLDIASGELTEVTPARTDQYFVDLAWSADGATVLASHVDRTATDEQLAVVEIDPVDGSLAVLVTDGINPIASGDRVFYLAVDAEQARRSIGVIEADGALSTIPVGDGRFDLDHLLAGADEGSLYAAVLDSTQSAGFTMGTPAEAHGNHDVSSTWWSISTLDPTTATPTGVEPTIVYDAVSTGGAIVYPTLDGLSISDGVGRIDLIASRAIRFVAG